MYVPYIHTTVHDIFILCFSIDFIIIVIFLCVKKNHCPASHDTVNEKRHVIPWYIVPIYTFFIFYTEGIHTIYLYTMNQYMTGMLKTVDAVMLSKLVP